MSMKLANTGPLPGTTGSDERERIARESACVAACEGVSVWPGCVKEMREMLEYAERIIDYFANDRRSFTGSGTPHDCLAKVSILLTRIKEEGK